MKHKIEIAPNLAIYIDGERVIGSKPYGMFLTTTMIVSDDDLKRLVDRCIEVIADRKTEPQTEIKGSKRLLKGSDEPQMERDARNCMSCKYNPWVSKVCNNCNGKHYEPKGEQTKGSSNE